MKIHKGQLTLLLTFLWLTISFPEAKANTDGATANDLNCPEPALERLKRHLVAPGETLESIAGQYNLIPATLMGINPSLRRGQVQVGSEVLIPPYNGVVVEVSANQTWRDVAAAYRVREILVYEANGCQEDPRVVFVPGVNWSPGGNDAQIEDTDLKAYPLPSTAPVVLGYGWLLHPITRKVFFHSGLDIMATPGTPVLAVGDGTVAFAGDRGNYGNLVVINHQQGQQSRYAHLDTITVTAGQTVRQGEQVGTVGATGEPDSDDSHLHFEVRHNSDLGWVAEDPKIYLRQAIGVAGQPQQQRSPVVSPAAVPATEPLVQQDNPAVLPVPAPPPEPLVQQDNPVVIPVPPYPLKHFNP